MLEDRFSEKVRKVMYLAREEAVRLQHDHIGTEHLLLGLIREGTGVASMVLTNLGLDLESVRQAVEEAVEEGGSTMTIGEIPLNQSAQRSLELAMEEAKSFGNNFVGTEHLLLGLLREKEGLAAVILFNLGVDFEMVRQEVMRLLGGGTVEPFQSKKGKSKTPALDFFCRDLTQLAREENLDPIIGREKEIERVMQILSRRKKNNPVLIGEAGVGKTAIVEGLAQRVVAEKVPEALTKKRVLTLDLAAVVAGTKYRGQFEERLKAVLNEIRQSDQIIIFIDELHTLVGAGAAEGAIDASNMLKPSLARGEILCIGATTMEEYRKHIEKDGALERRFQTVMVDPPSAEETIEILKGLSSKYESHHRVKYTPEALKSSAILSDRYISDRHLPDKAIDVIDEAGSRVKLSRFPTTPDFKKEEEKLERIRKQKEAAIAAQDFEAAARLRDEQKDVEKKLEDLQSDWEVQAGGVVGQVTDEDVREVISMWTGVPLIRLGEKEQERLLKMEEEVEKRLVGQKEAIQVVSKAIRRGRAGLKDPRRPIGSFVFLGPTGVGKTEMARQLAQFLFNDVNALIRIDMSEYMEKFNTSRLIGAPPGYVGYDEGGQLTERVRRKPYSVILFDEIEKAHPEVFNILLQILEDGQLTDAFGRKVNFKNTVLIMTSNIGTREISKGVSLGFQSNPEGEEGISYDKMKEKLLDDVKRTFNPEFLNRLDEIVVFHSLDREEMKKIVRILLDEVKDRLKEKSIELILTDEVEDLLVEEGFDPNYGARPLRRAIQKLLEDPLSEEVLQGKYPEQARIRAIREEKRILFKEETTPSLAGVES
jgi:ATP-dependent Clp protease ATP-binding subunit ClpC